MSKKKRAKPVLPPSPDAPTNLPGGPAKIIQICEDLRVRNTDGYLKSANGGGILADVSDHGELRIRKGTVCTPFTGTVIGVAFDPHYPRKDLEGDPYVPKFNGGKDRLPFRVFYNYHNANDHAVDAVVRCKLAEEIDPEQMRRGDLVEISWFHGEGHGVFCWDVHLNAKGEVDCFQYLGANGNKRGGHGVTIKGCTTARWLTGEFKNARDQGTLKKAGEQIFVDDDDVVKVGEWLVLPRLAKGSINLKTFRVPISPTHLNYPRGGKTYSAKRIRVARFHYAGDPPAPYCMNDGAAASPTGPGHADAPVTAVKSRGVAKNAVAKNPETLKKVPTKLAPQDGEKPTDWQHYVEHAMQDFFAAKWIAADPGAASDINDGNTQAAIREFQTKFQLSVDGIANPKTREAIRKQLPACRQQRNVQEQLGRLFRGNKLLSDPGAPNGTNNPETAAAVMEFQQVMRLEATGIPDADTQAKLQDVIDDYEPSDTQHGLEPAMHHLYWVGNTITAGGSATLRLHSRDLMICQECPILLKDEVSGTEVAANVKIRVAKEQAEVSVPIPTEFRDGSRVHARISTLAGASTLEASTRAPLFVREQPAATAAKGAVAPADERKYRKWRITTYYRADQGPASDSETVPVYDTKKNVLARVAPAFFSKMSLEGDAKLRDGTFLKVAGKKDWVSVAHDDYAGVWEYHKKRMLKRPPGYSGLMIESDRVVKVLAFQEVPSSKLGKGYGVQRHIPYEPFRTLAADLGTHDKHVKDYRGQGGLVPAKTKVFIKEYVGVLCPDGTGGTFVHDGWFVVNDTGAGIFGAHFDVFVGTKEMGKRVRHPAHVHIWFEGIEDRVPADYTYGLYDK